MAKMDSKNYKYKLAIIICTYNPDWEALKKTIESSLLQRQEGLSLQIVVTDDGSEDNMFDEVKSLFEEAHFSDYVLVGAKENQGTVKNYVKAFNVCEAEYVKGISPGDYFYSERMLGDWVDTLEKSGRTWSFADSVYYSEESGKFEVVEQYAHPRVLNPYLSGNDNECRWNYIVYLDVILGAAVLYRFDVFKYYLDMIDGKVKYGEDFIFLLMNYDGFVGFYYPANVIYYEYGSGISTSGQSKWQKLLSDDLEATYEIMFADILKDGKLLADDSAFVKDFKFKKQMYLACENKKRGSKISKLIHTPNKWWLIKYNFIKDNFVRKTSK